MIRAFLIMLISLSLSSWSSMGCGLDWTLPQAHFDGIEEHGYVAYWERIGEADLGDGLVIPVNIGFNSHRESNSPTLGKGWIVPLLESHVEPVDENSMNVIMPDGWTSIFLRNGNTETWRGNDGWVGESNNTIFTITAPCGWRIKYDGGKIREIDTDNNRTLSYKYNGPTATEMDSDGKVLMQVVSNTTTGVAEAVLIRGQKVDINLAQRPRIQSMLNQNLVTGFDQSLSQLEWADGKKESFAFGTDKNLNPTLAITLSDQTQRNFSWDATTRLIKTDGEWNYSIVLAAGAGGSPELSRTNTQGQSESYQDVAVKGITIETLLDGSVVTTYRFVSGPLMGKIRKIESKQREVPISTVQLSYDEQGHLLREELRAKKNSTDMSTIEILYNASGYEMRESDSTNTSPELSGWLRYNGGKSPTSGAPVISHKSLGDQQVVSISDKSAAHPIQYFLDSDNRLEIKP